MNRSSTFTRFAMSAIACAGLGIAVPGAAVASPHGPLHVTNSHCDPSTPECGLNPALQGPPPPFATIDSSCPAFISTDAWNLDFTDGRAETYDITHGNADAGGFSAEGRATLSTSDNTVQYAGRLTERGTSRTSTAGQTATGFTLAFEGTGVAGHITIRVRFRSTVDATGTPTSSVHRASVIC